MKELMLKLAHDFNDYSELVALNYAKEREGKLYDKTLIEWNRGYRQHIEDLLKEIAKQTGAKLIWECGEHEFGFDDWKRTLEYKTVQIDFSNFKV